MFSHTRKVGSLGRYGVRIGRKIRSEAVKIEAESRKSRTCPTCFRGKLRRVGAGVWACRNCGFTFAGGAHIPVAKRAAPEEKL